MNTSYRQGPVRPNPDLPQAGLFVLAVGGLGIWATLYAAGLALDSIATMLTLLGDGGFLEQAGHAVIGGISGIFAGVAIAIWTALRRKDNRFEETFISALFRGRVESLPWSAEYFGRVAIDAAAGLIVGSISGAAGALTVPDVLLVDSDMYGRVAHNAAYPVAHYVISTLGGSGGPGPGDDVIMAVVLLIMIILLGLLTGFVIGLIVQAVTGAAGGAGEAFALRVLRGAEGEVGRPIRNGAIMGAKVGLVTGLMHSVCTAIIYIKAGPMPVCTGNPGVCQAQQVLYEYGYEVGDIDGLLGRNTYSALAAFQKRHDLPVTGRLDPQTTRLLGVDPKLLAREE
jgi:hypothetical protein